MVGDCDMIIDDCDLRCYCRAEHGKVTGWDDSMCQHTQLLLVLAAS